MQPLTSRRHVGQLHLKRHAACSQVDQRQATPWFHDGQSVDSNRRGPRITGIFPEFNTLQADGIKNRKPNPAAVILLAAGIVGLASPSGHWLNRHHPAAARCQSPFAAGHLACAHDPTIDHRKHDRGLTVQWAEAEKIIIADEFTEGWQPMPRPE